MFCRHFAELSELGGGIAGLQIRDGGSDDGLLQLLRPLLATPERARGFYPLLLLARRPALALRGLPVDPDGPVTETR